MPLSSIFLFKDLSESRLKRITDTVKETRIKKGNWLFHEGHSADRFYALKNGAVELFTRVDEDLELPVTIIREVGAVSEYRRWFLLINTVFHPAVRRTPTCLYSGARISRS